MQPLEALRPGMKRDFMVVEDEEEYGQVIVSLAAMEVRPNQRWSTGCDRAS